MTAVSPARSGSRLLAVLLASSLLGCGGEEERGAGGAPEDGAPATIPAVEAVQARRGSLPLHHRLTGTVRAGGQITIFPETTGPVIEVLADNGDYVEQGSPLVRIQVPVSQTQLMQARANLSVAQADLLQAEANLEEMETQFERTRLLAEDSLVSREMVETQRAQLEAARANHARALAQVEVAQATIAEREEVVQQTVVRAPITGRVGQRNVEVGMRVDPQTPLFVIGRLENMRVEVPVSQEMLSSIREGQRVEISGSGWPDTVITAEVSRISPFLQEGSYSAEVEIDVPNEGGLLVPGMFVTVDIFYGDSEQATIVPTSALYEDPVTGEQGIFVTASPLRPLQPTGSEGAPAPTAPVEALFVPVLVLAEGPQTIAVEGLQPEQWVVVLGQHLLSAQVGGDGPRARARPADWDRVLELQRLQRDDLLRSFLEKQQRIAREQADSLQERATQAPSSTSRS